MPVLARVGIDFGSRSVRYAEVQAVDSGWRLLRLGQCDFDFHVAQSLIDPASGEARTAIEHALMEALGDSSLEAIRAVLHPPICRSFFSATRPARDPMAGVGFEAELLGFSEGSEEGIAADAASRVDQDELLHATAINPEVLERLGTMVEALGADDAQAVSGVRAAVEVARLSPGASQLLLGHFEDFLESAYLQDGRWIFARHATHGEHVDNALYGALESLGDLGIERSQIDEVRVYGPQEERPALRALFGKRVKPLNPLRLVKFDRSSLDSNYTASEFVSALGAAIL